MVTITSFDLARLTAGRRGWESSQAVREGRGLVYEVLQTEKSMTAGPNVRSSGNYWQVTNTVQTWADWDRLLQTGRLMVEKWAAGAPDEVHDEACIRLCGYLLQRPERERTQRQGENEVRVVYDGLERAMQRSGAAGMLSSWRVRSMQVEGD